MSRRLRVEADGGSRGNPGPAAYGAVVRDLETGRLLAESAAEIGVATNNVAEYRGLIAGLRAARAIDPDAEIHVALDSKLVVEQMSGRWKIKHDGMRQLALEARAVFPSDQVTYTWIPREQNRDADRLVNAALDGTMDKPRTALPANTLVGWSAPAASATTTLMLRHGETTHTVAKRFSGSGGDDPVLSERGRWQAEQAAGFLATHGGITAVVSSPMRRTRETGELVAGALGAELLIDDDLRECDFGAWDGYTFAEVRDRWPEELVAWLASTAVRAPDGESFDDVRERVNGARERIVSEHEGANVLLVTHVTPVKTLVRIALDAPSHSLFRMELRPASLTTIVWFADGNASLRAFNDTSYLRDEPTQHTPSSG
ncbi:MAG: bifunctional RNase H/acid phosphatase [Actinomycetes bacterium]